MRKGYVIAIVVLIILGGVGFLFSRKGGENQQPPGVIQKTVTIKRGDLHVIVSATGTIQPIRKVEVKCKASGQIIDMPVEEGDRVNKGDLIARLDPTDTRNAYQQAKADLEVAEATLEQAKSTFDRQKELFEKGLISKQQMDQAYLNLVKAKASLVTAQASLSDMELRLKDTWVRAPISGIILQKNVEVGQIIASGISSLTAGTLMATVANMDSVYVKADVDEVDIGQVKPGQKAKVVTDAFPDEIFRGEVIRISPLAHVQQNVTTFSVTILVPNPEGRLKAGMNATVDITVADRRNVLLVPREALKEVDEVLSFTVKANLGQRSKRAVPDSLRRQFLQKYGVELKKYREQGDIESIRKLWRRWTSESKPKLVMLKKGRDFLPHLIRIGVSDFDYAEVLEGLKEGDEVLVTMVSWAMEQRQRFLDRLRRRTGLGVFKRK